jgi:hypothetical protein
MSDAACCFLWILSGIEMGEKGSVGEIVEMGGIIAHAVFESGHEVMVCDVMMMALTEGLGSY